MDTEKRLEQIADRYRSEGYEVILKPQGKQIPSFARGFHPDLIVAKGPERVIVQVKHNLSALSEDRSLPRFAEVTNAQPGWRFDLVILEEESPLEQAGAGSAEPPPKRIHELLDQAERSAAAGDVLSAFLVAWAGLEAAMRYRSRLAGAGTARPAEATVLVRSLYSVGLLSSEELRRVDKANRMRTQVVHGLSLPRIPRADVDYLLALARRLLKKDWKPDGDKSEE